MITTPEQRLEIKLLAGDKPPSIGDYHVLTYHLKACELAPLLCADIDTLIAERDALRKALITAKAEIAEHSGDYHHVTTSDKLRIIDEALAAGSEGKNG